MIARSGGLAVTVVLIASALNANGSQAAVDRAVSDAAVHATAGHGFEAWVEARHTTATTFQIDAGVRRVGRAGWTRLPTLVKDLPFEPVALDIAGTTRGDFWVTYPDLTGVRAVKLRSRSATFAEPHSLFSDLPGYSASLHRSNDRGPVIGTSADGSVAVVADAHTADSQLTSTVVATLAGGRGSFVSTMFPASANHYAFRTRLAMSTAGHLVVAWSERQGIWERGLVATRGPRPDSSWVVRDVTRGGGAQAGRPAVGAHGLAAMGFDDSLLTFRIGSSTDWTESAPPWAIAGPGAPMTGPSTGILSSRAKLVIQSRRKQVLRCEGGYLREPVTWSFRWFRGATRIKGARASTYTWSSDDLGKRVSCRVTAKTSTGRWRLTSRKWTVPPPS